MKKLSLFAAVSVIAAMFFAGCTTVESTQKFNRMGLGTADEKAVCQTYVEIPGYFLFGLPLITGSPAGDGEWSLFRYNLNATNAVYLLTKEAKARQASRVINVQVRTTETFVFFGLTKRTIQASGTGVRSRSAAIDQAAMEHDRMP